MSRQPLHLNMKAEQYRKEASKLKLILTKVAAGFELTLW